MVSLPDPGRVVSVNVGSVETFEWRGRRFRTAIHKTPVEGRRTVARLGIDADTQVDRRVHGGVDKAVYGYAAEHRAFWEGVLGRDVGPGAFGENLTLEGLLEDEVCIGDRFRLGTAVVEVSEPRQPCSTLAAFHRREDLVRIFTEAAWPGIYFRVIEEGDVGAGDAVERLARGDGGWTVREVFRWVTGQAPLPDDLDQLLALTTLADSTRAGLEGRRRAALTSPRRTST